MKQRGFILLASLIMLILITLLAVSMLGGITTDARQSANYREKTRAVEAAQVTLGYAEQWLSTSGNVYTGTWNTGINCSNLGALTTPTVCSNALAAVQGPNGNYPYPANLPWPTSYSFPTATPSGIAVNSSGGIGTYAANPGYYTQYLGLTSDNPPRGVYQVTSAAQGGNTNAVAVLQATYQIQAISLDLSGS